MVMLIHHHVSRATKFSKQEQQGLILPADKKFPLRLGVCRQPQCAMAGLDYFVLTCNLFEQLIFSYFVFNLWTSEIWKERTL